MLDFTINQCKMSRLQTLITTFILAIVVAACGGMADRRLAEAEEIMDNAPDSALVILQSIRPSDLRSEHSRALHSLLITQARSKNYIPIPSDSIIRQTADYFDGTSDTRHRMLAYYYLGDVRLELKSYAPALTAHFEALDLARELDDKFYIAMAARGISQIYHSNYCFSEELEFAKIAYENFLLAGRRPFTDDGLFFLASAYHNNHDYEKSVRLSRQLLDTIAKTGDKFWLIPTYRLLGLSLFSNKEYDKSLDIYQKVCESAEANPSDSAYFGLACINLGDTVKAYDILTSIPDIKKGINHWLGYEVYSALDSTQKAFDMMTAMYKDADRALYSSCKRNISGALIDYNSYKHSIIQERLKYVKTISIFTILIVCFLMATIIYFAIRHHRNQQAAIDRYIRVSDNLYITIDKLRESEEQLQTTTKNLKITVEENENRANTIITNLIRDRFDEINNLCQGLYENDTPATRKKIVNLVNSFINGFTDDDAKIKKLEDIANLQFNGIMTKLSVDFPKLIKTDRLFILYTCLGFSTQSIAFLLHDERITTTYDRRKRIKRKFTTFEGENKPLYLSVFS